MLKLLLQRGSNCSCKTIYFVVVPTTKLEIGDISYITKMIEVTKLID